MLKLAADENFNGRILRGLLRHNPHIDVVRIQDSVVYQADDPTMLAWAASEGRILLTHDVRTITKYAQDRVRERLPMPGVFEISQKASMGIVIDDLLLLVEGSLEGEWEGQIQYIPLK